MPRNPRFLLGAAAPLLLTLVAAGCGAAASGSGGGAGPYGPAATTAAQAPGTAAVVGTHASSLGPILVDGRGRTLYLFEQDRGATSTCAGSCAAIWPPLTTTTAPQAGAGAAAAKLGTTRRADGTLEVTYERHPLYLYAGDAKPGDTTGQGVDQFGAEWYVLSPAGAKVESRG
jgi:predicted lipoprotein with Yx(FWY)xxD motif